MKRTLIFVAFALSAALLGHSTASAACDLKTAAKNFFALTSWQAGLNANNHPITLDYQAPNRFQEQMPRGMTMTFIGNQAWMVTGGRTMPLPSMAANAFNSNVQTIKTMGLNGTVLNKFKITSIGSCAYHLVDTTNNTYTVDMYLDPLKDLPIKAVTATSHGPVTVDYSRFNDPTINITQP
jgi:hypothetical protein